MCPCHVTAMNILSSATCNKGVRWISFGVRDLQPEIHATLIGFTVPFIFPFLFCVCCICFYFIISCFCFCFLCCCCCCCCCSVISIFPFCLQVGGFLAENFIMSENRQWLIENLPNGSAGYHSLYNTLSSLACCSVAYGYFRHGRSQGPRAFAAITGGRLLSSFALRAGGSHCFRC